MNLYVVGAGHLLDGEEGGAELRASGRGTSRFFIYTPVNERPLSADTLDASQEFTARRRGWRSCNDYSG